MASPGLAVSLEMIDCRTLAPRAPESDGAPQVEVPPAVEQLDRETHASWGGGLTLEQYLRRERVLRAVPFARRGLRTWILRLEGAAVASCESYETDVTASGRRGLGHGIASVYVPTAHRGHGYASELLKRVHEVLRKEGVLLCFLMSEIGPTLYERLGYVGRPLMTRRFAAASPQETHGATPPWELLSEAQVPAALQARKLPVRGLSIEASPEHVLWHMARGRYYAATLGRKAAQHVGAVAGAAGTSAMALWAPDYKDDLLRILTLYPGSRLAAPGAVFEPRSAEGEALRNVLHAGRAVAAELGLSAIELWENPHSSGYLRGGVRTEGKDVPMVLGLQSQPKVRGEEWLDYERAHWL